jgi:Spy/CpxP family protein refolding chaperone
MMSPMWRWLVLFVVVSHAPGLAEAQGRQWWRSEAVRRELALTSAQAEAIDAIFREDLDTRRSVARALEEAQAGLERAIADGNEPRATQFVSQVVGLQAEQNKRRTVMLLRISWLLTPDQKQRLDERRLRNRAAASGTRPRPLSP